MIIGNGSVLACVEDSKITNLFWPTVNNFQNMVESRLGIFSFETNSVSWLDEWKSRQHYIGNSNVLETIAKKGNAIVSVKDFILPIEDCMIRLVSSNEPSVVYVYTKTQLGECQKKDSVAMEGRGMIHQNKETVLCISSNDSVREYDIGEQLSFDSLEERKKGETSSVMSFFTAPNKKTGTHDIAIFMAIANSAQNVDKTLTGVMNVDPEKWLYKTRFFWETWLKKAKLTDVRAQRALLNMKMLMDREHGGFASSTTSRYSWIREGVYAAYAFDLAGYNQEAAKFYSWLRNAITRHKYLFFADGTITNNNEKRTDQLATAIWGICSHYLKTKDEKFIKSMWTVVRDATDELKKNYNPKTGLMSPSVTPWEDGFNVNAYTAASAYAAFQSAALVAQKLGRDEAAEDWIPISQKLKESYIYMCSDNAYHRAYNDKDADSYLLSMVVPFAMVEPWNEKFENTAEKIEKELWDNGLKRNKNSDRMCAVSTAWLAWFHKKSGNMKKYRIVMDSLDEKFTSLGIPSFAPQTKNDVSLWPHAMYIIARMD
ncbi:MAG: hypothetical protein V1836_04330 [Candidatus Aenigmatarchaeota archaeon]